MHAGRSDRLHAAAAAFLAEVAGVVVGQAQHVEAGCPVVQGVTGGRTKQVAGSRVAALLRRFAAVDEHALQVAEGHVSRRQERRHVGEKADAVVVRQMVSRVVGTDHHVADRRNREPHGALVGGGWRRRLGQIGRRLIGGLWRCRRLHRADGAGCCLQQQPEQQRPPSRRHGYGARRCARRAAGCAAG